MQPLTDLQKIRGGGEQTKTVSHNFISYKK